MRSAADYLAQLKALLPFGRAWPRDEGSTLGGLLAGLAEEFARVDGRALALLDEADPHTALELLPDWERALGLPDSCSPIPTVIRERQLAVARKLAGLGGQTPAFFIELARKAGLDVRIEEFEPFAAGSSAGDELCDDGWRNAFLVVAMPPADGDPSGSFDPFEFTAGSSAGERLRSWGASDVECLIERAKPAHSTALFSYEVEPEPLLWFDFILPNGAN